MAIGSPKEVVHGSDDVPDGGWKISSGGKQCRVLGTMLEEDPNRGKPAGKPLMKERDGASRPSGCKPGGQQATP